MSVKFPYFRALTPMLLRAFRPIENFVLLHTTDEVLSYGGR